MTQPTITGNYTNWAQKGSTNTHIERLMDDATYTSAHPDDTLVIAGPPRLKQNPQGGTDGATYGNLTAVGMLQNISINQQKPFQPLMAIGSSRTFYVGGKAQGSAQVQRLFMNTHNLMRRLYDNVIVSGGINPGDSVFQANKPGEKQVVQQSVAQPKAGDGNTANPMDDHNYLINLDSEFFLIPFGLGLVFSNKARGNIGGLYMELAVIPNFTVAVQAGQSMIMEAVTIFFDRVIPLPTNAAKQLIETAGDLFSPESAT